MVNMKGVESIFILLLLFTTTTTMICCVNAQVKMPKDVHLQLSANQPNSIAMTILPSNEGSAFTSYNVTYWSKSLGHSSKAGAWINNNAQQITCTSNRKSEQHGCGFTLNPVDTKFWTNKFPTPSEPQYTQDYIKYDFKELVTLEKIKFSCHIDYSTGR